MAKWAVMVLVGLAALVAPPAARADDGRFAMVELLNKPVDFQGFDDPKETLQAALEHLSKRYGLAFVANERAFREEQVMDVAKTEIAQPFPVPPMPGHKFELVLQRVLSRIPAPSGATYLVRSEYVEITTNAAARAEIWGDEYPGPFLPLVHVHARKLPLDEVLRTVADRATLNIVVDPRAKEKAATDVTARLLNTPADTALNLLADMAGLKAVRVRNVFYVTTAEHAAEIRKELDNQAKKDAGRPKPQPAAGM